MGWLTVDRDRPTLRAKVADEARKAWARKGGAVCEWCGKPIPGSARKANYHPKCARAATEAFGD